MFRGTGAAGSPSAQGGAGGGGFGGIGRGGVHGALCSGNCFYYAGSGAGGGYGANAGVTTTAALQIGAGGGGGFGGNGANGHRPNSVLGSSLHPQGLGSGGLSHQTRTNSNQSSSCVFGGSGGGYGKGPHCITGVVNIRYIIQGNKVEE